MYEQNNTMMETKTTFQIPQLLDGDDLTSEHLADDMEGLRLSFTRIKIPGGGHLQFEIPSGNPDVPDYAPYLEGVILYSHNSNAYWPEGSEYDDDQPPLCQSFDGKVGYGEPGGTCADCVLNQFGSDGNNKGKACKNMRMLYLLRSGEYMPIRGQRDEQAFVQRVVHPAADHCHQLIGEQQMLIRDLFQKFHQLLLHGRAGHAVAALHGFGLDFIARLSAKAQPAPGDDQLTARGVHHAQDVVVDRFFNGILHCFSSSGWKRQ